jgi:hypothetical protein
LLELGTANRPGKAPVFTTGPDVFFYLQWSASVLRRIELPEMEENVQIVVLKRCDLNRCVYTPLDSSLTLLARGQFICPRANNVMNTSTKYHYEGRKISGSFAMKAEVIVNRQYVCCILILVRR